MILDTLITLGMKLIDKIIPDPAQKQAAQLELMRVQQTGELAELNADMQLMLSQSEVNKAEAASDKIFVAGWRPFIGWVCGGAFCYHFILLPLLLLGLAVYGKDIKPPVFDMDTLNTVLFGMLGLGTMRTMEKFKKKI